MICLVSRSSRSVRCDRSSRPRFLSSGHWVSTVSTLEWTSLRLRGSTSPTTSGQRGRLPSQLCPDRLPAQKQRPLECRNRADMEGGEKKVCPSSKVHGPGVDQVSPPSCEMANK